MGLGVGSTPVITPIETGEGQDSRSHHHDIWGDAFAEVQLARQEKRQPNPQVFIGLTKAAGERSRCPKCGEKL